MMKKLIKLVNDNIPFIKNIFILLILSRLLFIEEERYLQVIEGIGGLGFLLSAANNTLVKYDG